jgi:hypothetical protein
VEALRHRLREIDKRREVGTPSNERVALLADRGESCGAGSFEQWFEETRSLRKKAFRRCWRATPASDNICFDGLARVSHVTDATDWRVEYPFVVLAPDTEEEMAPLVARLHRTGPDHHPARRRHRLHRRRDPARCACRL